MIYLRPSNERGRAQLGWLDSYHSFSFGHYHDPKHMGFSALSVINEDTVKPGAGFDTHSHRDMEIISYVLEGSIEHRDSMGNQFIVPAGEVQRMSAGTGISHSEFNHSKSENLRFLQIWIQPNTFGQDPGYEQSKIRQTQWLTPLVTPDGRDGSLSMRQDASLYRLELNAGDTIVLDTLERPGYLHILEGNAEVNGNKLTQGDGLGAFEYSLHLQNGGTKLTALWFDLPSK